MDRYELLKPIGAGKSAEVFKARRKADGALVALKRVAIGAMDERGRAKCLKEVRLLQTLEHPNIIRYLDSFLLSPPSDDDDHDDGGGKACGAGRGRGAQQQQQQQQQQQHGNELVIVVEWAAAGDLRRQLRKAAERGQRLPERTVWRYFHQVCEALRHMHAHRVLHRDLKPANIFLTLSGHVKVGDFGLSRLVGEQTLELYSKVSTPLYMAAEVLRGDGYSWESDLWNLGCLLYELAQLRSPFKQEKPLPQEQQQPQARGTALYALFQRISLGDYPPLPSDYSPELHQLAQALLSVDPAQRPGIEEVCRVARRMRKRFAAAAADSAAPLNQQQEQQQEEGQQVQRPPLEQALRRVALSRRRKAEAAAAAAPAAAATMAGTQQQEEGMATAAAPSRTPQTMIGAEEDQHANRNPAPVPTIATDTGTSTRRRRPGSSTKQQQQQQQHPPYAAPSPPSSLPSPATGAFLSGGDYAFHYGARGPLPSPTPPTLSSYAYAPALSASNPAGRATGGVDGDGADDAEPNPREGGGRGGGFWTRREQAAAAGGQPQPAKEEAVERLRGEVAARRQRVAAARAELAAVEQALGEARRRAEAAAGASAPTTAAYNNKGARGPSSGRPPPPHPHHHPHHQSQALAELQAAGARLARENRVLALREGLLWQRLLRLRLAQADAERRRRISAAARCRSRTGRRFGGGRRWGGVGGWEVGVGVGGEEEELYGEEEEEDDWGEDEEDSSLLGSDGSGGGGGSSSQGSVDGMLGTGGSRGGAPSTKPTAAEPGPGGMIRETGRSYFSPSSASGADSSPSPLSPSASSPAAVGQRQQQHQQQPMPPQQQQPRPGLRPPQPQPPAAPLPPPPPPPQQQQGPPRVEPFLLRQYSSDAYEAQEDGGGGDGVGVIGEDAVLASGSGRLGISYTGYQFAAGPGAE